MKPASEMPSDLDHQAKRKWLELVGSCDLDVDQEMLANYCRQHSSLLAIRAEKKRQQKSGKFKTTVPARDGTKALNPLLVAENRLIASLNRMLKSLGLSPPRVEHAANRQMRSTPPPTGLHGTEPPWGWAMEEKLCGKKGVQ